MKLMSQCVKKGFYFYHFFSFPDNPSQVSRVLVAIETLDLNDNAPELDRQYTTALCDSSSIGQVSLGTNVFAGVTTFVSTSIINHIFGIPPDLSQCRYILCIF